MSARSAGLEAVRRKLRTHARAAIEEGRKAARRQGEVIARIARTLAPQDEDDLVKSIRVEDNPDPTVPGVIVKAGNESTIVTNEAGQRFQNAKLQEGGTRAMPASPYLNPAKRMQRKQTMAAMKRAVRKGWLKGS